MEELHLNGLPEAFDRCLAYWHTDPGDYRPAGLLLNSVALELSYRNYLLWHEEDKARRDDQGYEFVYRAKRNIDRWNQRRNDCIERIDTWFAERSPAFSEGTPMNSETPGMIIDRLSILAPADPEVRRFARDLDAARRR
jgi:hypothetical protein